MVHVWPPEPAPMLLCLPLSANLCLCHRSQAYASPFDPSPLTSRLIVNGVSAHVKCRHSISISNDTMIYDRTICLPDGTRSEGRLHRARPSQPHRPHARCQRHQFLYCRPRLSVSLRAASFGGRQRTSTTHTDRYGCRRVTEDGPTGGA